MQTSSIDKHVSASDYLLHISRDLFTMAFTMAFTLGERTFELLWRYAPQRPKERHLTNMHYDCL